ncbi:2-methylcitrate dehydratase [Azospirillum sp. TSH100]|uniref:MmgE/PrpD family protein n=1 Tax=Azospirillum sp. TSH100 TaxID=652764 RepID=UPI000D60D608|nr:MmgE/PrpD family protein [Azospirillum sp. TSH100]PWC91338.1 2-methylcitrate dehydratase [Azospirillum sp. TSH100]QCG89240.1 MmgE/PrpD family protein [Azospirillum sp. TSH100]
MTSHPTAAPPTAGADALARLAAFTAALRFADLPAAVVDKARVHILDTLGAALAGTRSHEFALVAGMLGSSSGGPARLWALGSAASARDAALVNGVAAHVFELDDTGGCDHSGAVVVPAVIAAAEGRPVPGEELLVAVVVGYEVGRRLLEAAGGYDRHNGAGWHSTGTCGAVAAAAAVARLWRLDAAATAHAITIATSFSSGLWAFIHDGAQTKKIHAGRAAEGGLLAAELARAGMTGPSRVFDDVWGGFFRSFGHADGDPARFTEDLGQVHRIMRVSLKPYAACRGTHSAIDAIGDLLAETGRPGTEIERIDVRASQFLIGMCGRPDIEPLAAAQMSLPLAIALRAVHGEAGLSSYAGPKRRDPRVRDLLARIVVEADPAMAALDEPVVDLRFSDGTRVERMVPRATGSPERPMTSAAVQAKFAELAGMALPAESVAALAGLVAALPTLEDVAPLCALLAAGRPTAEPFR